MKHRQRFGFLSLLTALVSVPGLGLAQTSSKPSAPVELDHARILYQKGLTLSQKGDFDGAIEAFSEGHRLSQLPGFIFNLAQAYRLKGDCAGAVRFYREFLQAAPDAPERAEATKRIDELGGCASEPSSKAAVEPMPEKEPLPVPEPRPTAEAKSEPIAAPKVTLHQTTDARNPSRDRGKSKRMSGSIGFGVGAALGIASAYCAFRGAREARTVDDAYRSGNPTWSESLDEAERNGIAWNRRAWWLGAVALGSAGAGGALYFLGVRDSLGNNGSVAGVIMPTPSGAEVVLQGSF
ncbi:MAG: hypothetical protein HY698_19635 [Deltaproteobacteria bacterium]|nr:hypothetical protein [Deltaproteobacteria bacterium]